MARCPHCRKVSSVGSRFACGRGIVFIIIGLMVLFAGIGITVGTHAYAQVSYAKESIIFKKILDLEAPLVLLTDLGKMTFLLVIVYIPVLN